MNQQLARQEFARHDPTFDALPPESQLQVAHQLAQAIVVRLQRRQGISLVIAVLALFVSLGTGTSLWFFWGIAVIFLDWAYFRRDRVRWTNLKQRVVVQAEALQSTEGVGPLLDFAHWLTLVPFSDDLVFGRLCVVLERLLPRLDVLRARQLSESQRAFLRQCVENQAPTVEFVVAALLVLGSAGDSQVSSIAQSLAAHSSSQRIRDAAILCLEELGQPT